jgi:ADP-ribose pyrophosphatase
VSEAVRKSWIVRRRTPVFAAGPIAEIAVEAIELPDGREIAEYYSIRMADFVLVFAEAEDGRILVLRQYKHGVKRVCLGFPGGALEEGETPFEAARRELLEETGYEAGAWRELGGYVTNSNQGCNTAHLVVATECRRVSAPTSPDAEAPDVLLFTREELLRPSRLQEFGTASHVALLALATHPLLTAKQ